MSVGLGIWFGVTGVRRFQWTLGGLGLEVRGFVGAMSLLIKLHLEP